MKRRDLHNDIVPVFAFDTASRFKCIHVHTEVKERRGEKWCFIVKGTIHAAT